MLEMAEKLGCSEFRGNHGFHRRVGVGQSARSFWPIPFQRETWLRPQLAPSSTSLVHAVPLLPLFAPPSTSCICDTTPSYPSAIDWRVCFRHAGTFSDARAFPGHRTAVAWQLHGTPLTNSDRTNWPRSKRATASLSPRIAYRGIFTNIPVSVRLLLPPMPNPSALPSILPSLPRSQPLRLPVLPRGTTTSMARRHLLWHLLRRGE